MTKEDITPELRTEVMKNWPDSQNPVLQSRRMAYRNGFILGAIWQKKQAKKKESRLMSDEDEWYFGNLFAHLDIQRALVLSGKKDKIDKTGIINFVNKYK